jgi:hypothetical protein
LFLSEFANFTKFTKAKIAIFKDIRKTGRRYCPAAENQRLKLRDDIAPRPKIPTTSPKENYLCASPRNENPGGGFGQKKNKEP